MRSSDSDIYDPAFVSGMFDRMARTYGLANYVTSFGFTARWRRQCVADLPAVAEGAVGYDLMSGMGEVWGDLQRVIGEEGNIIAVDISEEMNRRAAAHRQRLKRKNITLRPADVLDNDFPAASADFIVSTFGLKTFDRSRRRRLAREINRLLKPGGGFALIEISVPRHRLLRWPFMFYLKVVIPVIGRLFLGNAEDYQMLGTYTAAFKNCRVFHGYLREEGLRAIYEEYFWGCATGVWGWKGNIQ